MSKSSINNRVTELRHIKGSDLRPHPKNPRRHPDGQIKALDGILEQVGIADALIVYRAGDGVMTLIDGHCRGENWQDIEWPCLVLDVTDEKAELVLATHDPLCGLATLDQEAMDRLLEGLDFQCAELMEAMTGAADEEIPDDNKDIDEDALSETAHECPKCGFEW